MNITKLFNTHRKNAFGVLLGLGLVVLVVVLVQYNSDKSRVFDGMTDNSMPMIENVTQAQFSPDVPPPQMPSANTLQQESYLPVHGGNQAPPQSNMNLNPNDLLPHDTNSDWASINPASNDLQGINLLTAGQLIGINTVGNSLRNPNLQIRSEPIIPKMEIGPWNQSTMENDPFRRGFEIGSPSSDNL
jgi:hypothetical protein